MQVTHLRACVVAEAERWLGTPYHFNARVLGVGVDCALLLAAVYEAAGVIPHVEPEYPFDWHLHRDEERFVDWVSRFAGEIDPADAQAGDTMLYRFGRTYSHGAIVVAPGQIIHSLRSVRMVTRAAVDEGELFGRPQRAFAMRALSA